MNPAGGEAGEFQDLANRPNRALIIMTIGSKGTASFTELKSELNIGVGTLYYHLDGLSKFVSQNASKQYVLTDLGGKAYDFLKTNVGTISLPAKKPFKLFGFLREVFFLESPVGRLGSDPGSNAGIAIGIVLLVCVLSADLRLEPTMLIPRLNAALPNTAVEASLLSWAIIFAAVTAAVATLRTHLDIGALGTAASFALVPTLAFFSLTELRRVFKLTDLNFLYSAQGYPIIAVIFAAWAAYILTISLRASARLSFERALVITLTMLLINVGYLWLLPILKF
jgi:hypothetical protein